MGNYRMSELSPHIPDLDLITFYSEKGTSLVSRISPWTKALMLVVIIIFVSIVKSLILAVCLYLIVLAIYGLSGLSIKKLFQWYTMPLIFVLSLVLILMWNEPGIPIFSLSVPYFSLTLTDNGLLLLLTLLFKSLASVTYSLFLLMTTRYDYFSAMIYRVFPYPIDQIFLISGIQGVHQDIQTTLHGISFIAAVNMDVAIIESVITGYVVSYIMRVRPDMLKEVTPVAATAK
jgi:cobalt/nickel transport system permease protein